MPGQLRALGGRSIKPIVRVGALYPDQIARVLDWGAKGIMVEIESVNGVKNVKSIAAVDGVDVLFVGPADLCHDLEHHSELNVDAFDECLAAVVNAVRQYGKAAGILCRNTESITTFAAQGFTEIAVESDLSMLRQAYQQVLSTAHAMP